jgi:DNA helicase-2/ATP-dependent DNA helicase PcrA
MPANETNPRWKRLNQSQLNAVKAVEGMIQITAVAGSGKTTVLTERTTHMVENLGIDPSSMALMTFTGKAAEEMEKRLKTMINASSMNQMFCGTAHSFGYGVLAYGYKELDSPMQTFTRRDAKDPGVLTGGWVNSLAKTILDKIIEFPEWDVNVREKLEKEIGIKSMLAAVSFAKNNNIDEKQYAASIVTKPNWFTTAVSYFYTMYEQEKRKRKCIDFDDMLFLAVRMLVENPRILRKYQAQYKYIMTDETQDNNKLQYMLSEMIAYPEMNLFIVGDDDQAMYSFRGADPDSFINFSNKYPQTQLLPLEDNYRSQPDILNRANKLIAYNTNRIVKQLVPHKQSDDECVFYSHFEDEIEEAEFVVSEIEALIANYESEDFTDELSYKQLAVLYRTNAQCKEMEDALISKGIPYVIHGGISFYERREVKDILSYLRLVLNNTDNEAFKRVVSVPTRYLGKAFLDKLTAVGKGSYWANVTKADLTFREKDNVSGFIRLVNEMRTMNASGRTIEEIIEHLMINGYRDHLNKDKNEDDDTEEIVDKLKFFVNRFENIEELLDYVTMMTGKKKESVNGVQLMTIHRSKGQEFHAVFVIGANENLLPHYRSIEASDGGNTQPIEEERRLGYVAATRAEEVLYWSSTTTFNDKPAGKSRFIDEMELKTEDEPEEDENEEQEPIIVEESPTVIPSVDVAYEEAKEQTKKQVKQETQTNTRVGIGQLEPIPDLSKPKGVVSNV